MFLLGESCQTDQILHNKIRENIQTFDVICISEFASTPVSHTVHSILGALDEENGFITVTVNFYFY